jgi:predicted nucleic acid-binding protein
VIPFCDSSALTKLHIRESGSQETESFLRAHSIVAASEIAGVEIPAAFTRPTRCQPGDPVYLNPDVVNAAIRPFDAEWETYVRVPLAQARSAARQTVKTHRLRAYDAIQLGSALALLKFLEPIRCEVVLVAFDTELRNAATAEGISVWPSDLA